MDIAKTTALILGKPLKKQTIIQLAFVFTCIDFLVFESGILSQSVPQIPVAWQLLIFIPLLFSTLTFSSLSILRHPRKPGALFAYGLSFIQKKECVLFFIRQKTGEIIILISLCYGLALCGEIIVYKTHFNPLIVAVSFLGFLEVKALEWAIVFAITKNIIKPSTTDKAEKKQAFFENLKWQQFKISAAESLSKTLSRPLKNPYRALARRQFLYFMYGDFFMAILLPVGVLAITAIASVGLKNQNYQILDLITALAPYSLLVINQAAAFASGQKLSVCTYYSSTSRDFFIANSAIALLFCLPFTVIFIANCALAHFQAQSVFRIINFLSIQLYLIVLAGAWYTSMASMNRMRVSGYFIGGFGLIALLGIMIPFYGALFPLAMVIALYFLEPQIIAEQSF